MYYTSAWLPQTTRTKETRPLTKSQELQQWVRWANHRGTNIPLPGSHPPQALVNALKRQKADINAEVALVRLSSQAKESTETDHLTCEQGSLWLQAVIYANTMWHKQTADGAHAWAQDLALQAMTALLPKVISRD